eukprot:TRINITY_DN1896_c0_g1_i1.p1 TRINITY_DN1896_c0_g1~~TRINITY_DN1896_c0_g1_i1.p1  ORF type:complete len:142 (+),score=45.01 TRINITY_DN1896_c0_g1_i1:160-585(+)
MATVRVLYSYEAQSESELSIQAGEILNLTEKKDGGWWLGEKEGKVGFFPTSYVEEVHEETSTTSGPKRTNILQLKRKIKDEERKAEKVRRERQEAEEARKYEREELEKYLFKLKSQLSSVDRGIKMFETSVRIIESVQTAN